MSHVLSSEAPSSRYSDVNTYPGVSAETGQGKRDCIRLGESGDSREGNDRAQMIGLGTLERETLEEGEEDVSAEEGGRV